ncbi:methylated-DNA--[protein]-cysteine S-methyltransferase [Shewanella intestini]|uniref:Methylated-DNA--[protein]-cysteine S-methyltransferase n=2 Tax=Shewanellaceae TaxID=267890 RepID=A0ABS5I174_9GAMM|nr:methylated-DNA--[protein]-cysteine S-methyltransferase [Shewanella intestini]MRG35511.1 methylated-DNA--[protein]-cysteine S-methyltransferase [Shewanella sp. XMDDZSB0408]
MERVFEVPDASISTQLTHSAVLIDSKESDLKCANGYLHAGIEQLINYFNGTLKSFNLTLSPKGTVFQQQVWQALTEIPYGSSCSYSDIANKIQRPKAVRAVGAANGANPIAIVVPCHRVIGKSGKLTGYAHGLAMKQYLLNLEVQ